MAPGAGGVDDFARLLADELDDDFKMDLGLGLSLPTIAVMGLGVVWFSVSGTYLAGFLARVLIGLGGGVIYIATLRYCANWFRTDEFATVTGLTLSASAVGGLLAATPLAVLVGAAGWRDGLLGVGLVGFVLTGAVFLLVRDTPTDAGLTPVEGTPDSTEQSLSEVFAGVRTVFDRRDTWIMGWMLFFAAGINFTVMGLWGVPYIVQAYDVSVETASVYTLVGNAVATAGLAVSVFPVVGLGAWGLTELTVGATLAPTRVVLVAACSGAVLAVLAIAVTLLTTYVSYRLGLDPDDVVIPVVTNTCDVLGVLVLFGVVLVLL